MSFIVILFKCLGEFIVQADNTTSKADELTVENGQVVSSVKLIRESWLRKESNEKGGVFPKQWVKVFLFSIQRR